MSFPDRAAAGRQLAALLAPHYRQQDVVVLGLPRGGIPVACEVARAIDAPLDLFVVRKIGTPSDPEIAAAAVASGGVTVINESMVAMEAINRESLARAVEREHSYIAQIERRLRGERAAIELAGKRVILVDDGLATGATMRAALQGVRMHKPLDTTIAVPVAPDSTYAALRREVEHIFCIETPIYFRAVSQWYSDFHQLSDEETQQALTECRQPPQQPQQQPIQPPPSPSG